MAAHRAALSNKTICSYDGETVNRETVFTVHRLTVFTVSPCHTYITFLHAATASSARGM